MALTLNSGINTNANNNIMASADAQTAKASGTKNRKTQVGQVSSERDNIASAEQNSLSMGSFQPDGHIANANAVLAALFEMAAKMGVDLFDTGAKGGATVTEKEATLSNTTSGETMLYAEKAYKASYAAASATENAQLSQAWGDIIGGTLSGVAAGFMISRERKLRNALKDLRSESDKASVTITTQAQKEAEEEKLQQKIARVTSEAQRFMDMTNAVSQGLSKMAQGIGEQESARYTLSASIDTAQATLYSQAIMANMQQVFSKMTDALNNLAQALAKLQQSSGDTMSGAAQLAQAQH